MAHVGRKPRIERLTDEQELPIYRELRALAVERRDELETVIRVLRETLYGRSGKPPSVDALVGHR